ncbi:hypothetical protein [Actinophytocola sp.]|uniref:hypothetical protein n=1 Tax=Actinophytocola sp. TaxID=1872138 RepID=UPI003D6A5948
MTTPPPNPLEWTVPVTDPLGRPREIRIFARDGRVRIAWPPGEGCSTDHADYLAAALMSAEQAAAAPGVMAGNALT